MVFQSLLHRNRTEPSNVEEDIPVFFVDLNMDQIMEGIVKPWKDFSLRPWFLSPLRNEADITYRQDVFRDLEKTKLAKNMRDLSTGIRGFQRRLESQNRLYDIQREGWFLAITKEYCSLVRDVEATLSHEELVGEALTDFRDYMREYIGSHVFRKLEEDILKTEEALSQVNYTLIINYDRVTVQVSDGWGEDYTDAVKRVFSRFQETHYKPKVFNIRQYSDSGYVQAEILGLIGRLYPGQIGLLKQFAVDHADFLDETVLRASKEAPFYLSYMDYITSPKENGLPFCLPQFTLDGKISANGCFDLALGVKLCRKGKAVVANDFYTEEGERIIVVTGPNNGGKTTFARSIGQAFYLASLGLPVPGKSAILDIPDRIFTHFERSENIENLRSKLEDDIMRIKNIIDSCTSRSVVIINEMLSSTTVRDATIIGSNIFNQILKTWSFCVFVTFLDEFSTYNSTISMVAQIDRENPEIRTFRILRQPSNGLAYAKALARKHHVSGRDIRERIANA